MSKQFLPLEFSFVANADLSALQFTCVKLDTSVAAGMNVVSAAAATSRIVGILQNKPTSGQAAEIALPGCIAKVTAGGSITAGDLVSPTTAGAVITASSGDYVAGEALEGGATGDRIRIHVWPFKI